MRDADIRAAFAIYFRAFLFRRSVIGHVHRLHPDGEEGGGARLQSDGGGGGIFLRRAAPVRIGVVQHQNVLVLVLFGFRIGGQRVVAVGHVVDRDIEIVLFLIVKVEILQLVVVVRVQPGIVKRQLVPGGVAVPVRLGFRLGGSGLSRSGGKVFPRLLGGIDNSAGRLGGGSAAAARRRIGGLRPTVGGSDDQIPAAVVVVKFEAAVCDPRGILFRRGYFGTVIA